MPALDLYVSPGIVGPHHPPRPTRPNSEERVGRTRDVSPDPMSSLIEATQLNGLKSQLRPAKLRRKGGMRRMDSDLISEKLLTLEEAEGMLELFKNTQSHHLFSASISSDVTIESIRSSSSVLFTALILVTAVQTPGREQLHEMCHRRFLGLVSSVMFDRSHTLDDLRGLCIAACWQPYMSWKLSGLSIRMATELTLHHAFYETFNEPGLSVEARHECLEKARLWYLLYVLDHQSSITYGRPPVMSELRPIKDYDMLLNSQHCTSSDRALIAQVTGLVILSRAFDLFGLEPKRIIAGDNASVLNHMRFTEDAQAWKDKWIQLKEMDLYAADYLSRGVELHHHFSNLVLNSLVLRGRPLGTLCELPASLRILALQAVEAAHSILEHFLDEPRYCEETVGMPLYLHSMIAFAVVFLMEMSRRWHAIGITIDPVERTIPLVEQIVRLLQSCRVGANHVVLSMAKGFERMLRQWRKNYAVTLQRPTSTEQTQWTGKSTSIPNNMQCPGGIPSSPEYRFSAHTFDAASEIKSNYEFPATTTSTLSQVNWGFQDDELWSVGMGYDPLDPGGQGLASTDFPFQTCSYDTTPQY